MEENKVFYTIVNITLILCIIVVFAFCLWALLYTPKSKPQHVHFLDTNECYNIKSSDVYKGVAIIYFDDDTKIKCSAENVVVYVNHPCDYCSWGH